MEKEQGLVELYTERLKTSQNKALDITKFICEVYGHSPNRDLLSSVKHFISIYGSGKVFIASVMLVSKPSSNS